MKPLTEKRFQQEAHELDRLPPPGVDKQEGRIVTWDETCSGKDEVPDTDVLEVDVDGLCALNGRAGRAEPNGLENDGGVQSEAVESNLFV